MDSGMSVDSMQEKTYRVPVLPIRDAVVLPGVMFPITAERQESIAGISRALDDGSGFMLAVRQRDGSQDLALDNLCDYGVITRIIQVAPSDHQIRLIAAFERRARVHSFKRLADGSIEAVVEDVETIPVPASEEFAVLSRDFINTALELARYRKFGDALISQLRSDNPNLPLLADVLANYVVATSDEQQELLETLSDEARIRRVLEAMRRDVVRAEAEARVQERTREAMQERTKETVLREQMRAIREELGEDDGEEIAQLRQTIETLDVPDKTREKLLRDVRRLEQGHPQSQDYQLLRSYLDVVVQLPWNERSEEKIDIAAARKIMNEDHYGLDDVKARVLEYLAVRKLQLENGQDSSKGPILLFTGPPGVGKTSIAKSIAKALGREYVRIALGGVRDEADIRGHRRTYLGAMPGRIIEAIRQAGTKNPVILLDEVDKLGVGHHGDPSAALLEVLDPNQNHEFTDHFLGVPFDLSEVLFIATANFPENISSPLRDRMETIGFSGYTEQEKLQIARLYLLPRQIADNGLRSEQFEITTPALQSVVSKYTREAGVRNLNREIGKIARKVALQVATEGVSKIKLGKHDLVDYLGKPKVHPERASTEDAIGVATGMYYTPMGGDIMSVEVAASEGNDNLILTGQLGDVMKESARAALTYAKTHAELLNIPEERRKDVEIHVHCPAGAIPKDGPSAGIAIATAMVSALSGRPARCDVAMTGEITLTGRVLAIGGVKEKVLGAYRAGIRDIVLPKANEADIDDIPEEVREKIKFHLVDDLGEALALTLRGASWGDGGLFFSVPQDNLISAPV